jgi:hypothetical protein
VLKIVKFVAWSGSRIDAGNTFNRMQLFPKILLENALLSQNIRDQFVAAMQLKGKLSTTSIQDTICRSQELAQCIDGIQDG